MFFSLIPNDYVIQYSASRPIYHSNTRLWLKSLGRGIYIFLVLIHWPSITFPTRYSHHSTMKQFFILSSSSYPPSEIISCLAVRVYPCVHILLKIFSKSTPRRFVQTLAGFFRVGMFSWVVLYISGRPFEGGGSR